MGFWTDIMICNGVPLRGESGCPIPKHKIVYLYCENVCVCVGSDMNVDSYKLDCI